MRQYTSKGRVVYNRPKHPFSCRDVDRIIKKSKCGLFIIVPAKIWENFYFDTLAAARGWIRGVGEDFRFGGGEFAGGGATRSFGAPGDRKVPAYLTFIMEENDAS